MPNLGIVVAMTTIPKLCEIPEEEITPLVSHLLNAIRLLQENQDELQNAIVQLKEENQQLRDEIAFYKGQKPRPKIPPSILEGPKSEGGKGKSKISRGKHPRKKKKMRLEIHQEKVIQPSLIPDGAKFKGYKPYSVQDIVFKPLNTQYKIARWQLPDGSYIAGELPKGIFGHYGPELIAYILHQCNACRVTEPLLLEQLHERGVLISAGQLNNILIRGKASFHEEAGELLVAGVEAHNQIQADDTGARHKGQNQYTTVIGNEWFTVFATTASKSRVNFFRLLQSGKHEYLINEDAIGYLEGLNAPSYLPGYIATRKEARFTTLEGWEQFLKDLHLDQEHEMRLVTEAALFACLIENGIPRDLGVHGDDAGQFNAFIRSLCWIHEERHYRKIIPITEEARSDLNRVRDQIWAIYRELKGFQQTPNDEAKEAIKKQFDQIFLQDTSSPTLTKRLRMTYQKKSELLRVLERPDTPLHNNSSETAARAEVTKRKVSGGTRSDEGRNARNTFLSLKLTCFKLGINFITFLKDRVSGLNEIPKLAEIIRQRSSTKPDPNII